MQDMKIKKLEFGTAGIRGKLGKNEDHLNYAHVQRVAHGFSNYLLNKYPNQEIKIAIGRDNRRMSYSFAICCAMILNNYGIKVFFSKDITPTPFVSYAILKNKMQGGINITASHNPAEYNGIKLYNEMGSQCLPKEIDEMTSFFESYEKYDENFNIQKLTKKTFKNINFFSKKMKDSYIDEICNIANDIDTDNIKLAYSPLHGTGSKFAPQIFEKLGLGENVYFVKKQMKIDRNFTHCSYPNPEKQDAYIMLEKLARKNNCDLFLVTDPDSDRVGLGIKHNDKYVLLNGNETATLIANFVINVLNKDSMNINNTKYMVHSYVSSNMPAIIAKEKNIDSYVVPTGFKWIGMIINEQSKQNRECIYAFEESYGSLNKEFVSRDKDALQSVVILPRMVSYYKKQGKTLVDVLNDIYEKYGYIVSGNIEIEIEAGINLEDLQNRFKNLNFENQIIVDYNKKDNFLKSNMIKIEFTDDNSWLALRPSGTEPKIKYYIFAFGKTQTAAQEKFDFFKTKIIGSNKN
ncbi:phospho-sugar mutase [Mycoplasmopsis lipofaciens]|uniref:phospho-sugar mutase n=1 Tax=Mycoplasmopsis lipofaciens TaxID=114884 RepID=UPI000AC2EA5E|nr:phospho-sugar mutase [Mycoplasmopsis lipofaciens]